MSEKTRADLKTDRDNLIKEGAAGSIQPAADNAQRKNEADSAVNILDNRDLLNLREHSSSRSKSYQAGEAVIKNGAIRQAVIETIGSFNSAAFVQLTPQSITAVVTAYSAGENVSPGTIRSYQGSIFRKIGGTVTGSDPYDTFEWEQYSPLLPYYGQLYVADQVYVTNMVVRKQDGSDWKLYRKVKVDPGDPEFIFSDDFATELAGGEWEEEVTLPVFTEPVHEVQELGVSLEVNSDSFHNKNYLLSSGVSSVTLGTGVSSGVKVFFYLKGGSINFSGTITGAGASHTALYIECCALSLGDDQWLITQTVP